MKSSPNQTMTQRLKKAIALLESLPELEQDRLAGILMRAMNEPGSASVQPPVKAAEDLLELTDKYIASIPRSEWSKLPTDGAAEHDHYLYGSPKKYS